MVLRKGNVLATRWLTEGRAVFKLGAFKAVGTKTLRVKFVGSGSAESATQVVTIKVVR